MDGSLVLRIVIAYENYAAGIRALEMAERLAAQLEFTVEVETDLWSFEVLRHYELRQQAIEAAGNADMIIVSGQELTEPVQAWIESWVFGKRSGPAALVALLDPQLSAQRPAVLAHLRRITTEAGIDFFCDAEEPKASFGCAPWGFERAADVRVTGQKEIIPDSDSWRECGTNN